MSDAYNATYDTDDVTDATTSSIGGFAVGIAGFAVVLGLLWAVGKIKKSAKF